MFLAQGPTGSTYSYDWDEANPAGWSYEEKVAGFAAYGFVGYNYVAGAWGQTYATSYYVSGQGPQPAQPPISTFCSTATATNDNCAPGNAGTSSACKHSSGTIAGGTGRSPGSAAPASAVLRR